MYIYTRENIFTHANGDLPTRYKPTFSMRRTERISEFWKEPLERVSLSYAPSPLFAIVQLQPNQFLDSIAVTFTPKPGSSARLFMRSIELSRYDENSQEIQELHLQILKSLAGPRPLPFDWKLITTRTWSPSTQSSPRKRSLSAYRLDPDQVPLGAGNTWMMHLFYCQETSISVHAHLTSTD